MKEHSILTKNNWVTMYMHSQIHISSYHSPLRNINCLYVFPYQLLTRNQHTSCTRVFTQALASHMSSIQL